MNNPIGIFDSGIGGLTVFGEVRRRLPSEHLIYLGDTARVPYGTKSPETVTRYSREIVRFLLRFNVKMIVVACNTASAFALKNLQQEFPIPIVGVIEPGVKRALENPRGALGVIGTEGTIQSGSYAAAIKKAAPKMEVVSKACPLFVPLVEEGWLDTPTTESIAETYLGPLKGKVQGLILGCTHYPLLKGVIQKVMGPDVTLVDSAEETAGAVAQFCTDHSKNERGSEQFFVTDSPGRFLKVGRLFLDPLDHVEKVDLG